VTDQERGRVSEGPIVAAIGGALPWTYRQVPSEGWFVFDAKERFVAECESENVAALLVAAREATEGMADPVAAVKALPGLVEALGRIAAETEGVPEQNCEIAYATATEALAPFRREPGR
jgi:hypothetical protein